MRRWKEYADLVAESILASIGIIQFAQTRNPTWLLVIPTVLYLVTRILAEERAIRHAEEEKEVWRTMYEMKCDEALILAEQLSEDDLK